MDLISVDGPSPPVVVVTGAASGIGWATVQALASDGVVVVGVDRAAPPDHSVAQSGLQWVQGDVASGDTWDEVVEITRRHAPGGAHGFVACAADLVVAPFLQTGLGDWRHLFEVNVLGVIRGMQALMPDMVVQRRGAVAVVCSVNSLFVEDQLSAYSTTKAALLHVVRSAALEHARHGLRINAVCPGAVDTPLLRRHLDTADDPTAARHAIERRTPTGRIVRPAEVAAVLRFLISDAATGLSGTAVTVDGGLTTTYDLDLEAMG